jgi:hypothetical protein
MKVSSNTLNATISTNTNSVKTNFTEKISKDEAQELKAQVVQNANAYAMKSLNAQNGFASQEKDFTKAYEEFKTFLSDIGYEGKPIATLSKDEAAALVAQDGFFGVDQTSKRIADFVINGAGGDENRLRAGREGMLEGFKMAEEMWGGKLPEISQQTMQAATELVDKTMMDLGFSILDKEA